MSNIVEEITTKSASLPPDLQHEVLDFVDFVSGKGRRLKANGNPFQSVRGILNRDLSTLETDLTEIRDEMWGNFPREVAK